MTYETFADLCKSNHVRPSDVSKATGIATSTLTSWKKGDYIPKADKLNKISEFFGVSSGNNDHDYMNFEEKAVLSAYRLADDSIKSAICKLLDVKRDSLLSKEA